MINMKKSEHGITIITLIITVLLLVIITGTLAVNTYYSVELSSLTNLENDIKALENRIASYYVENNQLPVSNYIYTKTELQNSMLDLSINDGENYYLIDFSKIDNITLNYEGRNFIINETSHNVYYLDGILYNGQIYHTAGKRDEAISVIDSEYFTAGQISSMLGKYVDYTPQSGTYSIITNNATYSGTADNIEDFTTEAFNWKIWSIDGNTLTLIADDVTKDGGTGNGTLKLYGPVGYNNCVKIINDICKNCYSNTSIGAIGRSINIEDIENVLDKKVWKPEDYSIIPKNETKEYYTNGEALKKTGSAVRRHPYIYNFEEYAFIENNNKIISIKKGEGLKKSEQFDYYSGETYSDELPDGHIEVTMTSWSKTLAEENYLNSTYYNLAKINKEYYIASRGIGFSESYIPVYYKIFYINSSGAVNSSVLCNSYTDKSTKSSKIRPMVEINLMQVTLDTTTTNGDTANAAYKLEKRV